MLRTTKLAVVVLFSSALAAAIFSTLAAQAQQASARGGGTALLAERLGKDDGYAAAIHYSADLHGSLETCG